MCRLPLIKPSRRTLLSSAGLVAAGLALPRGVNSAQPAKLTLAILFVPRGDFAPYYLARERGYYAQAGIDLTIKHVLGNAFAFQMLSAGNAEFAHADIVQMLQLQGATPEPAMKSVAVVCGRIPLSLFYLNGRGIEKPKDIAGRSIVDSPGSTTPALIKLLAQANGFDAGTIEWKSAAANAKAALMLQGQADAVSTYLPALPSTAARAPAGKTVGVFNFGDHGVDIYGDGIISTGAFVRANPDLTRSFVQATLRGYTDAFANPAAAVEAIVKSAPELDRANALKELDIARILNKKDDRDLVGFGAHNPVKMAATYAAVTEAIRQPIARPVGDFFTNDFLA